MLAEGIRKASTRNDRSTIQMSNAAPIAFNHAIASSFAVFGGGVHKVEGIGIGRHVTMLGAVHGQQPGVTDEGYGIIGRIRLALTTSNESE